MKIHVKWDCILAVVLFIGAAFMSGACIHYSYALADEYSELLKYALRVVGFIGVVYFPARLVAGLNELQNTEIIEDLQDSYNGLCQEFVKKAKSAHIPDDEDYKEDE